MTGRGNGGPTFAFPPMRSVASPPCGAWLRHDGERPAAEQSEGRRVRGSAERNQVQLKRKEIERASNRKRDGPCGPPPFFLRLDRSEFRSRRLTGKAELSASCRGPRRASWQGARAIRLSLEVSLSGRFVGLFVGDFAGARKSGTCPAAMHGQHTGSIFSRIFNPRTEHGRAKACPCSRHSSAGAYDL